MRRRLDLAMTLVGAPRVVCLDEPTTGLDPRSRRELWDIVRELVADGVAVLLTTQYLEEADRLAGGHIRLRFADEAARRLAARAVPEAATEPAVDGFSMHTPDLDDVFLALTDRPVLEETTR